MTLEEIEKELKTVHEGYCHLNKDVLLKLLKYAEVSKDLHRAIRFGTRHPQFNLTSALNACEEALRELEATDG